MSLLFSHLAILLSAALLATTTTFVCVVVVAAVDDDVENHQTALSLRNDNHHEQQQIDDIANRRMQQLGITTVPKIVGNWTRMIDFPVDTGESHGTMIGCDLVSVGGFYPNFRSGPRITYVLDLCDPTAQWRSMAEHPLEPFLTHAAHAHKGDDLMYLCGGHLGKNMGKSIKDCHVFNKTDGPIGSWKAMPSLPQRRGGGGLLYIESQDKLIFALGAIRPKRNTDGVDKNNSWTLDVSGVNLDDPTTGTQWKSRSGGSPYLGNHVTSVKAKDCAGNTRYYFLGGQVGEREHDMNIDLVYEYVPSTDSFVQRQSMPQPRGHFTTANWPYGCGFITVGGAIDGDPTVNTWSDDVLYYDIDSDTWTDIGTYPELIKTPVCGIISDVMYCANGYTVNSYKVQLSFPNSSTAMPTAMPTALPTALPTTMPTGVPTLMPTGVPTSSPTSSHTANPTASPTGPPADFKAFPTSMPTLTPSGTPSSSPVSALDPTVILDNDFSVNGFDAYSDDLFRGTSNRRYAQGWWAPAGYLVVRLGGKDNVLVEQMSGGHETSYSLVTDATAVTVDFRYLVVFESDFEEGEDTEVLMSVNGVLFVVDIFYGVNSPTTTGWSTASIDLGPQSGGLYALAVGGYLSKKDDTAERVRLRFDDVYVTATY